MKFFKICAFLSFSLLLSLPAAAQKNQLREADAAYDNEQYFIAKDLYKAVETREKKLEKKLLYLFRIAECYRYLTDAPEAEQYYARVIDGNYKDPIVYLRIADMQREQAKYKEAEKNYTRYKELTGDKRGHDGAESCKLAQQWIRAKTRYIVTNEELLNTKEYDFSPSFADRKNTELIFSSGRPGGAGNATDRRTGEGKTDLWITPRDKKGKWLQPTPLPDGVNTVDNEGAVCFDRRSETMYYTRCPDQKKKNLGCDIYSVERKSGRWSTPVKLNLKQNQHDSISVGHPTLTNDDQVLIFASDMPGGQGGKDLWMVIYDKRAKNWGDPINLGPKINTPGDEMFPHIHEDGSLYFASDGHYGMGGLDMFRAAQVGNERKWENPENLGYPLNSPQHDYGIIFEAADRGFFTSNRTGGKGRDDIYSFLLPPLLFKLTVQVFDEEKKTPLPNIEVRLAGTDNSNISQTTGAEGKLEFEIAGDGSRYIKENTTYTAEAVLAKGMLKAGELKKQVTTVGLEKSTDFVLTFYMKVVDDKQPLRLPEIVYEYDKADLLKDDKTNSEDSLLYLYNILVENPTINVQLRSHTDTRGSDAYNQKLSQRRAETCVKFLISKGIPKERMTPIGMGEREPRISDAEINKMKTNAEKEAAHRYNRRTDFKILNYDHVPTEEELQLQPVDLPWLKKPGEE